MDSVTMIENDGKRRRGQKSQTDSPHAETEIYGSLKSLVQQAKYDLAAVPAMAASVHDAAVSPPSRQDF